MVQHLAERDAGTRDGWFESGHVSFHYKTGTTELVSVESACEDLDPLRLLQNAQAVPV